MAESLGDRIIYAADDWANTGHKAGENLPAALWDTVKSLAARADAAERLAVADAALMVAREARDNDSTLDNWVTLDAAGTERHNARAAWRALEVTHG